MAVHGWHDENEIPMEQVHPLDVRDMFLRLVPFVLTILMATGIYATLQVTKSINLPRTVEPLTNTSIGGVITDNPGLEEGSTSIQTLSSQEQNLTISPIFTPEVRFWEAEILAWSQEWNLDPNIIATIMQIESCGDPAALSRSGAIGLFQVMPFHFIESEKPAQPDTNAYRGMAHLIKSIKAHSGNLTLAFAAYNAGIAGSMRPRSLWPDETIRYVYWATGIYEDAVDGATQSSRLSEWLAAGGRSLCRQAEARQKSK